MGHVIVHFIDNNGDHHIRNFEEPNARMEEQRHDDDLYGEPLPPTTTFIIEGSKAGTEVISPSIDESVASLIHSLTERTRKAEAEVSRMKNDRYYIRRDARKSHLNELIGNFLNEYPDQNRHHFNLITGADDD